MNFQDTLKTLQLVVESGEVPLLIGESGIGKTSLIKLFSEGQGYYLVTIDANLLKEGEIGGLPTVDEIIVTLNNERKKIKRTSYAAHTKLIEIEEAISSKKAEKVLLFIDEINRCEHAVQQELMNLILNREINGFILPPQVRVVAAMNPSSSFDSYENSEYQVVDMDPAQQDRFVWLFMDSDSKEWLKWAMSNEGNIHRQVIEFIAAFPEHLHTPNSRETIKATPRSWERVSKAYRIYEKMENKLSMSVLYNAVKGNVGADIAQDFISFVESYKNPMIKAEDLLELSMVTEEMRDRIMKESHSRLYILSRNVLSLIEHRGIKEDDLFTFVSLISNYPLDLRMGIMKSLKQDYSIELYNALLDSDDFLDLFFESIA